MDRVSRKVVIQVGQLTFTDTDYADDVALLVDKEESFRTALAAMDEEASKFGLRVFWIKTKLQNLGSGSTPSPITVDGNTVDEFTYLGSIQSSSSNSGPEYIRRIGLAASAMKKTRLYLESILPQNSEYTLRACYIYYSTAPRPGLSHKLIGKDWIPFIYGVNDASYTSAGTISCLRMKFCVVLACSTFPASSVNEDWVSLVKSPDFEVMHWQTGSSESVPRRGAVTGLRRSGDAPAVVDPLPGSTRSAVTRVLQRWRP